MFSCARRYSILYISPFPKVSMSFCNAIILRVSQNCMVCPFPMLSPHSTIQLFLCFPLTNFQLLYFNVAIPTEEALFALSSNMPCTICLLTGITSCHSPNSCSSVYNFSPPPHDISAITDAATIMKFFFIANILNKVNNLAGEHFRLLFKIKRLVSL